LCSRDSKDYHMVHLLTFYDTEMELSLFCPTVRKPLTNLPYCYILAVLDSVGCLSWVHDGYRRVFFRGLHNKLGSL
jgi:hypothetical protein